MKKYFTAAVLVIIAIFSFPRQNVLAGEETSAQLLDQLYEEVEMDQIDLSDDDYFYQITGYNDLYSFLSAIISANIHLIFRRGGRRLWTFSCSSSKRRYPP
jgi:hypothetical protein